MGSDQDPLFAALTRPAMAFGVALEGLIVGVGIVIRIFIFIKSWHCFDVIVMPGFDT